MAESLIPFEILCNEEVVARGYMRRSLAPITISKLLGLLPVESRLFFLQDIAYILLEIRVPLENSTKELEEGSVFYWPLGKCLGISLREQVFRYKVNPVGRIDEGLDRIVKLRQGSPVRIERGKESELEELD